MAPEQRSSFLTRLRGATAEVAGASDAQLIERFAAHRDEAAFELLLWRHARLVFGVCRHVLHDQHDAEDAFQATFLALARHAGRIARREALAGWLHKVAYRVALTARASRTRRTARETPAQGVDPASCSFNGETASANRELRHVLDQEISRLPERFRTPIVLCYLEGKSVEEASALLGCPRGIVASRLARARERLRLRLAGGGLALGAALAIASEANASARVFSLIPALTASALRYTAGGAAAGDILLPRVSALTEEVLRAMFFQKLKSAFVIAVALLGLSLVGGGLTLGLRASAGPETEPAAVPEANADGARRTGQVKDRSAPDAPRTVTVSRPARLDAAPYDIYDGRLEPLRAVEVRPGVSGVIKAVRFKAGDEVKKGDLLFDLESDAAALALQKAEAGLAFAEAKLKQSEADFERARRQMSAAATSREDFEKATGEVAAARAAVATARVDVGRANLDLQATKIRAPMSGQVGRPLVEVGTLVFRGPDRATHLTTVRSLDPIGVAFAMPQQSYLRYQRLLRERKVKGTGSRLRLGLGDDKGFPHEATLESFEDQVNPESDTVRVRGQLSNPDRILLPGMSVSVEMRLGPPHTVLAVPQEAIHSDQGGLMSSWSTTATSWNEGP